MFIQIFVANPNKPRDVKIILGKNQGKLLGLLHNLSPGKGYYISVDSEHVVSNLFFSSYQS